MATSASARSGWSFRPVDWIVAAAAISSVVFIWLIAVPAFLPAGAAKHAGHLTLVYAHIAGGTVMLLSGAANLRVGLTRQGFRWHRPIGFAYLASGAIAASIALIRSFDTRHTPGISTATLAITWLIFTAMAWRAIRNRRVDQHREWMIRSYVVAWTFVFCRFYTRAMPDPLQGSVNDMIWLTWVAPVLAAEILIQWKKGART